MFLIEILNPDTAYKGDIEYIYESYSGGYEECDLAPGVYQVMIKLRGHCYPSTSNAPEEWDSFMEWENTQRYRLELPFEQI